MMRRNSADGLAGDELDDHAQLQKDTHKHTDRDKGRLRTNNPQRKVENRGRTQG